MPLASLAAAADLLAALRPALPSLEACDFFIDDGMELVLGHLGLPAPVRDRAPAYVLLECAAARRPGGRARGRAQDAGVDDALVADATAERERLWRVREAHTEAIAAAGVPHKLDVGVPLDRLGAFAAPCAPRSAAPRPDARVILFGHLGDGNVHVNVLGAPDDAVDEAVLRAAAAHGGTISAEHGVGVAKARLLPSSARRPSCARWRRSSARSTRPTCSTPAPCWRQKLRRVLSPASRSRAARSRGGGSAGRRVARSTKTCTNQPVRGGLRRARREHAELVAHARAPELPDAQPDLDVVRERERRRDTCSATPRTARSRRRPGCRARPRARATR